MTEKCKLYTIIKTVTYFAPSDDKNLILYTRILNVLYLCLQVGTVVDAKLKEADHFIDEKREEVVKQVQEASSKATDSTEEGLGAVIGKAKGLLHCKIFMHF